MKMAKRKVPISEKSAPSRKPRSAVLAAIHEAVAGLHEIDLVGKATMREFNELCLSPVLDFSPSQLAAIRIREKVSQPVFARHLNVGKSTVSQWERGEKRPTGAALKLLNVVAAKGLKAIA